MKSHFACLLLLVCVGLQCCSQLPGKQSAPVEPPSFDGNCYKSDRFSLKQRLNIYPFSKAQRIALVSFRHPKTYLLHPDSLRGCACSDDMFSSVPGDRSRPGNQSVLEEVVMLDATQIDSLSSILYNYSYAEGMPERVTHSGCYYPHNAILFYNQRNEIFAFIELCFSCGGYRFSYKETGNITWCDSKFNLLESFFSANHIKIGIDLIPVLPEEALMPQLKTK